MPDEVDDGRRDTSIRSLTHSLRTHSLTHSLTPSLTHSLTHSPHRKSTKITIRTPSFLCEGSISAPSKRGFPLLSLSPVSASPSLQLKAMKVAIVGSGGVGGYFGGRLAQLSDVEVHFLLRPSSANVPVLRAQGLRCKSIKGDFTVQPHVATSAEDIGPCDFVLVCVKTYDLQSLAPTLRPLVSAERDTAVIPLLNGFDAPAVLSTAVGAQHVAGGLCLIIAYLESPGVVVHTAGSDTQLVTFGEMSAPCESPRIAALKQAFLRAGVAAFVPSDEVGVVGCLWEKFVKIVSFSGATAVCRCGMGYILDEARSSALFERLQHEGLAVASAHGGDALMRAPGWEEARLAQQAQLPRDATASMQRDMLAGRPSELHEQLGAMVRLAEEKGVQVPTVETVYAALLPQENAARRAKDAVPIADAPAAALASRAMRAHAVPMVAAVAGLAVGWLAAAWRGRAASG